MHVILVSIVHFIFGDMLWFSSECNLLVIRVLENELNIICFTELAMTWMKAFLVIFYS